MHRAKIAKKVMKTAEIIRFSLFFGANDVTRTHDLLITNQLLYRLSYISVFTFWGFSIAILSNNRRPTDYESVALPAELHQHIYFLGLSILLSLPTTGDLLITNQLLYVSIGNDEII